LANDGVGIADGLLNILRVVVESADDDEVFQTAGNEELAVFEEA
jgi:hypothetical protein